MVVSHGNTVGAKRDICADADAAGAADSRGNNARAGTVANEHADCGGTDHHGVCGLFTGGEMMKKQMAMNILLGALLAVVLYVNAMAAGGCTIDLSWDRQSALHVSGGPYTVYWWDGFHWNNLGTLTAAQSIVYLPVQWMTDGDVVYGVDKNGAVHCSGVFAG